MNLIQTRNSRQWKEKFYVVSNFLIGNTYNPFLVKSGVDIQNNRQVYIRQDTDFSMSIADINENLASYIGTNKTLCACKLQYTTDTLYYLSSGNIIRRPASNVGISSAIAIPIQRIRNPKKIVWSHKEYSSRRNQDTNGIITVGYINSNNLITQVNVEAVRWSETWKKEEYEFSNVPYADYIIINWNSGIEDFKDIAIYT